MANVSSINGFCFPWVRQCHFFYSFISFVGYDLDFCTNSFVSSHRRRHHCTRKQFSIKKSLRKQNSQLVVLTCCTNTYSIFNANNKAKKSVLCRFSLSVRKISTSFCVVTTIYLFRFARAHTPHIHITESRQLINQARKQDKIKMKN